MPLIVYIKNLVVSGKHGVHAHEKTTPQRFGVNAELVVADETALTSDQVEDTIDWSGLRDDIISVVEGRSYNLIERLAQEVADTILKDERVAGVVISIDKLDAFDSGVPGIRLEITRAR